MIDSKTNYNAVGLAAAVTFSLLGIFLASGFIFTSDNPFTKAAMLIGGLLLVVGTIQPRRMLYVMVPITFYLDEVKRLLVVIGRTGINDVTAVLAIAPLASVGILLGCVIRRIFFRKRGKPVERLVLIAAGASFIGFGGMEAFTAGSLVYGLKTVANSTVYFLLPWAVLQCFRTREDIERYLRFSLLVGIPVALYGIWQYCFGLSNFEISYLKSGLSITAANLDDIRPRPFSTLSSTHAYSIMMAFMLPFSMHFIDKSKHGKGRWKWMMIAIIYAVALFLTLSRSATIAGLAMVGFAVLFRSGIGTSIVYGFSSIFGVGTVLLAETIQHNLDKLQSYLPLNSVWQEQAFRLGTFSDRLQSYRNVLGNPSAWPLIANPFTYRANEEAFGEAGFTHDLFSQMILRIGAVPVFCGVCFVFYMLWQAHRVILRLPRGKGGVRSLAACFMAVIVTFLLSQSGGAGMTVFPLNFWMSIFAALLTVLCIRGPAAPAVPEPVPPARVDARRRVQEPTSLAPKAR
jgi:hypothetical protein